MSEDETKKPRRRGTGLVPPAVVAEWNARGYVTPAQAAEIAGVARTTVYGWAERGALKSRSKKHPAVVKDGVWKWLLRSAVEKMRQPAVDAAIAEAARTAS